MPPPGPATADSPAKKYKAFIDAFLPTLANANHENRVAYLYLDSEAHLTIGIGHLLAKHPHRNDRQYVQASIQAIFKYGFTDLKTTKAPVHTKKANAAKPGPQGAPKPPPPPTSWWSDATHEAEQWWHDLWTPGPHGAPKPVTANPTHPKAPVAPPLVPGITVAKLTDDALKIMAMDIHYTKPDGSHHIYGAAHYKSCNRFGLTESGIDSLGFDDVLDKIKAVKNHQAFKDFDAFPESAKQAVIDLAFQRGDSGLARETAFANAVQKADWTAAAAQVPNIAGPARTAWRRKQLQAAAGVAMPAGPGLPFPR